MKHRQLIYGGLAMLSVFPLETGNCVVDADSKAATSSLQLMKGDVVMLSGEVCVVKDEAGKSMLFKIDKETKLDGSVKERKKVEVSASADGRALVIKESS